MPVNDSLADLAEPFKKKAELLVEHIEEADLPFKVFETRRAFSRSAALYMKGRAVQNGLVVVVDKKAVVSNARAGESPHNWGLAMDCVLVVDHAWWAGEVRPSGPWDDGRKNPVVALAWKRYGDLCARLSLEWGGNFKSVVDLPHVQLPKWSSLRPSNWKEVAQREVEAGR